ncbi:MAG: hypothetical protein IE924_01580 [Microbacterium sp.]|uniref:hypothetical protein n=1 Tax=Microbacterium sp. TaxID=51671 RepID=UPI0019B8EEAE|nr:hypothetical protein [Microbacterium sp.]MBD3756783.1 hypothetical protein [Microbacterium sp.]
MATVPYRRLLLTPGPTHDHIDAVAGVIHDPLWFAARQWQVGEFQGENATTPVLVDLGLSDRAITHDRFDPAVTPAEVIIESESDDWWTMGRRIRLGAALAAEHAGAAASAYRFPNPPPPYAAFAGAPDGLAIWRARDAIGIATSVFAGLGAPIDDPDQAWVTTDLEYTRRAMFGAHDVALDVERHRGGPVDWFTVDATPRTPDATLVSVRKGKRLPTRIHFPGAPMSGVWQIEDADDDLSAIAPDTSHPMTAVLTQMIGSRHDEWFDVPVGGQAGTIATVTRVVVHDGFGQQYDSSDTVVTAGDRMPRWPGLRAPESDASPWPLFHTRGLDAHDLVLWHLAEMPLTSDPIERVQFGIDEAANVLWAVEVRIDHRDAAFVAGDADDDGDHESLVPPIPVSAGAARAYVYVPGEGAAPHWIPYTLDTDAAPLAFVQRSLVDLSTDPPTRMPWASASVIAPTDGIHSIRAAAVPSSGMELTRRWHLARDVDGEPLLWIGRHRAPLLAPPARTLRFDVAEPVDAPENA